MIGIDTFISQQTSSDRWLNVQPLALLLLSIVGVGVGDPRCSMTKSSVSPLRVNSMFDSRPTALGCGVVVDDEALLPRVPRQGILDADRQQPVAVGQLVEEVQSHRQSRRHQLHDGSDQSAVFVGLLANLPTEDLLDLVERDLRSGDASSPPGTPNSVRISSLRM